MEVGCAKLDSVGGLDLDQLNLDQNWTRSGASGSVFGPLKFRNLGFSLISTWKIHKFKDKNDIIPMYEYGKHKCSTCKLNKVTKKSFGTCVIFKALYL